MLSPVFAQPPALEKDTFFLAKKKGLIGKLGQQLSRDPATQIVTNANPFSKFGGKIIRSIEIIGLGLKQDLLDTFEVHPGFAAGLADRFHRDTRESVIRKNLFFKTGDVLRPLLMTDNDRHLREQPFLKDALIIPMTTISSNDSVDIAVIIWDVFSIGGNANINNEYALGTLREENLYGRGGRASLSTLVDFNRNPKLGLGMDYLERNVGGLFFDWDIGFTTINNSISSRKFEEYSFYSSIEKPLVSRFTEWTGGIGFFRNQTRNDYLHTDSFYRTDVIYNNLKVDVWAGYNFGWRSRGVNESEKRFRNFLAGRLLFTEFDEKPLKYNDVYNYDYADVNGVLISFVKFRQNFNRTNFVYGFGRNEDVASGINASFTTGWTDKENVGRVYLGAEGSWSKYKKNGSFLSAFLKSSAYLNKGEFQDAQLMAGVDLFTRLRLLSANWLNRNFFSAYAARQFDRHFDRPLFINSFYGLPYFRNDSLSASTRLTIRFESVFINLHKILGFRFAPFVFSDLCTLMNTGNTQYYPAFGGGVRTRNENLLFGTIELRAQYFPRILPGMDRWKIGLRSNLKFKFSSQFINKPDFINFN